ncbi:unnamed protein product [Trichogramma brassicae]|uniref:Uncharacterized protein n=1 Tax=Trichogramma brassicae TaxID=86971 RepID=A0A6H5IQ82_9HYME|nr:unnamed protein product [Trichogramma brassicae]
MDIARSESEVPALEDEAEVVPLATDDAAETVPVNEGGLADEECALPVASGDAEETARVSEIERTDEPPTLPVAVGDAKEAARIDEIKLQDEVRALPSAASDAAGKARTSELEQQDKECAREIAAEINQAQESPAVTMRGEWQRLQARPDEVRKAHRIYAEQEREAFLAVDAFVDKYGDDAIPIASDDLQRVVTRRAMIAAANRALRQRREELRVLREEELVRQQLADFQRQTEQQARALQQRVKLAALERRRVRRAGLWRSSAARTAKTKKLLGLRNARRTPRPRMPKSGVRTSRQRRMKM